MHILIFLFTVLHFELRGTSYLNNTVVMLENIGEAENALYCVTSNENCCTENSEGEFFFPDGTAVPNSIVGQDFFRNRGSLIIHLNRRNAATSPTGRYRCEIPDADGNLQSIFINIGELKVKTLNRIPLEYLQ